MTSKRKGFMWLFAIIALRLAWVITVKDYRVYQKMSKDSPVEFGRIAFAALANGVVEDYSKLSDDLMRLAA